MPSRDFQSHGQSLKSAFVLLLAVTLSSCSSRITRHVTADLIAQQTGAARQRCDDGNFDCVPFYNCDTEDIITDGFGLLDIRFGGELTENAKNSPTLTHSECKDFLDVCCLSPHLTRTQRLTESKVFQPQCGRRNKNGLDIRIDGFKDHETQFGEFPWQVAIVAKDRKGRSNFLGAGSLIHPQVVLTAVHTVRRRRNLEIRLGDWDTQHETEYFNHLNIGVKQIIRHPEYNGGNLQNDIALVILSGPVDLQPHIDTICLPTPDFTPTTDCIVAGWGRDAFTTNDFQTVLKSVSLPIMDPFRCETSLRQTRLPDTFRLHESFMCAGGRWGEDACTGDGGSALVCEDPAQPGRYVQTGIVSWGVGCGQSGVPGVYVDVRKFTSWISQELFNAGIQF